MSRATSPIREADGLLYVYLCEGFEAVVDEADRQLVDGYRWSLLTTKSGHAYACRREGRKAYLMHRQLLDAPPYRQVDHEDGDGLDNRRKNIRLATPTLNQANKVVDRRNKLGVKGVQRDSTNRFRAYITPNGRKIHLGSYRTIEEASAAYEGAARVLWGNFAKK